jgi:hypothetical protein
MFNLIVHIHGLKYTYLPGIKELRDNMIRRANNYEGNQCKIKPIVQEYESISPYIILESYEIMPKTTLYNK